MKQVESNIHTLIEKIQDNPKYQYFDKGLVDRLTNEAQTKYKKDSLIIKSVRTTLHQIGGAYLARQPNYVQLHAELDQLPTNIDDERCQTFLRNTMMYHASTAERMDFIQQFFQEILRDISPISSIADLGCGFTPLAYPLMALSKDTKYYAYDIYEDMIEFLNHFFAHFSINGYAKTYDISQNFEMAPVQMAFLLKTMPLIEQLNKQVGSNLLSRIKAEHILVSFPIKSLGGHDKGMRKNYTNYFESIVDTSQFSVKEFVFPNELAYLLTGIK